MDYSNISFPVLHGRREQDGLAEVLGMDILELDSLTAEQETDVLQLMAALDPLIPMSAEKVRRAVEAPGTHFFVAMDGDGHIAGCASLCVFESPTGRKASVEDVVVGSAYRGRGLGRALMERLIDYACTELVDVDLHLTSRPQRAAANELYRSLGFERRETNAYKLTIRGGRR